MNEHENTSVSEGRKKTSFGRRFLRLLSRMLLVAILGVLLGAGGYYGIPAIYRGFIQPVQTNSQRITSLEQEISALKSSIQDKDSQTAVELADLQGRLAEQREAIAELLVQDESMRASFDDLKGRLEDLETLPKRAAAIETAQKQLQDRFEQMELSLEEVDSPVKKLSRQYQLLRVMELVTRARFWMVQNNLGLAAEDVASARRILSMVLEEAPEMGELLAIIERFDLVLFELPQRPVIAADDLEIAWKLLILATEPQSGEPPQPDNEMGGTE